MHSLRIGEFVTAQAEKERGKKSDPTEFAVFGSSQCKLSSFYYKRTKLYVRTRMYHCFRGLVVYKYKW